jgi:FAD binding domain
MTIAPVSDLTDRLDALRHAVDGVVALPSDPDYPRCAPWNVAATVAPAAVVFVRSARDVAETVRFAAAVGLTVAVEGTGHGALPVGPESILVHTGEMTWCEVDPQARVARVGAGATWQHVLDAATPHGLAPLCGSSPSVGVVGFLTGGGIGPLVRSVGVSSDYVLSFELVTGAGDVLRVTPDQHSDLFWGLRGGKATLGIITAVELQLPRIPEFYGGAIYFDGADATTVLHEWRRWSVGLPESVSTSVAMLQLPELPDVPPPLAGRFTVAVRYVALGDPVQARELLTPIRAAATPLLDAVGEMPYAAIAAVHADPPSPMPVYENHALLNRLTIEAVEALLAVAGPQGGSLQTIVELRLLGGAFARPARYRSAFCHRDAAYALTTIGAPLPELADAVAGHAASVIAAMASWSSGRQLPNFAPATDTARLARCYDEETLFQLAALAERYDPAGVLRVGQVARYPL